MAVHCKGPDPIPSLSPLALPMPTPRPPGFCGLQTPHPRGQSRQKLLLWGVRLEEGSGVSRFLPARIRLLSDRAPRFKTSHMCSRPTGPTTLSRSCQMFFWDGPCRSRKQRSVFSQGCRPGHCFLTTVETNLHGLGGIYFGSLRATEHTEINLGCNGKEGVGRMGPSTDMSQCPMWSAPCLGAPRLEALLPLGSRCPRAS